jgi:hypothetical protein
MTSQKKSQWNKTCVLSTDAVFCKVESILQEITNFVELKNFPGFPDLKLDKETKGLLLYNKFREVECANTGIIHSFYRAAKMGEFSVLETPSTATSPRISFPELLIWSRRRGRKRLPMKSSSLASSVQISAETTVFWQI